MNNIIELSALRAARNAAPFKPRVTGRRRAGPPIYTLVFRSYASIVESAEADLIAMFVATCTRPRSNSRSSGDK